MIKKRKRLPPKPGRKPGRPKGTTIPPEKIKVRRSIRLIDSEWLEIVTAAESLGTTATDFIRILCIGPARRQNRK